MIRNILIVGSGSAGLIAALAIHRKLPGVQVRIVRSPDIGIIGVGEGTTLNLPMLLFDYLGLPRKIFYQLAEPTWKLGIRLKWGARGQFDYSFSRQLDAQWPDLPMPNGFYCEQDFPGVGLAAALMNEGKVFPRQANGAPEVLPGHGFHIENEKFVGMLETLVRQCGVEILDGKVTGCERGDAGVTAVHLEDGRKLEADFFIDSSGFRSELLGKALGEPFQPFDNTLFCDRAVVGGWQRTGEPILPYTTAEQMSTGWCWQIEHEHHLNTGYVYCSDMISDEDAAEEFKRKHPKVPAEPRIVKFRSGCYRRMWVDNVVALGNSAGFVEPLEATALMVASSNVRTLVDFLGNAKLDPTPSMRDLYNKLAHSSWMDIRDFLGLHYKFNTAMDTPFWQRCREETDLSGIAELLAFYEENGPLGLCRFQQPSMHNEFGIEGYLVMLVGMMAPHRKSHQPTEDEWKRWRTHLNENVAAARTGLTVKEALAYIRHPGWQWHSDRQIAAAMSGLPSRGPEPDPANRPAALTP